MRQAFVFRIMFCLEHVLPKCSPTNFKLFQYSNYLLKRNRFVCYVLWQCERADTIMVCFAVLTIVAILFITVFINHYGNLLVVLICLWNTNDFDLSLHVWSALTPLHQHTPRQTPNILSFWFRTRSLRKSTTYFLVLGVFERLNTNYVNIKYWQN